MNRKTLICFFILMFLGVSVLAMGRAPKAGVKAIDFTLEDLYGAPYTLSNYNSYYKDKIVFLNFWATWCPPCRAEMPSMQKLYESWDKNKFEMLAINIGEDKKTVENFAENGGYTFPILLDRDKKIAEKYMIRGIPTTYIINKEGKIVAKVVGSRHWTLEEIQSLIK
ncbi:MAG: TlpA family protein disulfide reductase [Candidatus Margulisbacteria bacterium]|nr:TlpA family protein disulfide reductase [Candidatus Margulisiibacteriota bacterium]